MIHPDTRLVHIDSTVGLGVVASALIPRGTITWVLDPMDIVITDQQLHRLGDAYAAMLDTYAYRDGRGRWILCWDHARFVNHSCRPTMLSPGGDFEIAVRDIQVGEQLCDDYGSLNLDRPMPCACGELGCRRQIRPEDFETCAPAWDELLQAAVSDMARVAQPMHDLLRPMDKRLVQGMQEGRRRRRSILSHRYVAA